MAHRRQVQEGKAWRPRRMETLIAAGGSDPPASPVARTHKVDRDVPARWENTGGAAKPRRMPWQ
jgi:hypothetical protein